MVFHRKKFYIFSGTLILLSVAALFVWGLNLSIDFTGGSLLEVKYLKERPSVNKVRGAVKEVIGDDLVVQPLGEESFVLRFRSVEQGEHKDMLTSLRDLGEMEERRFTTIGPVIGREIRTKSLWAVGASIVLIIFFIAWAFRRVPKRVSPFVYGLAAIVALFHDVIILLGLFSVLGKFYGVEIGAPFVAAILTIIGYSVNDTIVIFDRVRSNIINKEFRGFAELVSSSIRESFVRSFNTSLTTLAVLAAIFFFGGDTVRFFVLALIVGIAVGTYSSLFVASPVLIDWKREKV